MNKYINPEMAVFGKVIALSIAIFPTTIVISYGSLNVGVLEHVTESNSKSSQKFF
ncbi:MAG TPA: hypothetical protein VJM74_03430 [Nitrososphaeraceae archaeon]|nr:hypothetical protein [Nitrososphaeraceae archaeon]